MKEDLEGEIWKDVVGYEGLYQVSNMGRVYSLPKKWKAGKGVIQCHKGKILKNKKNNKGYFYVGLYLNEISKQHQIHVLVAKSFLGHNSCGFKLVVDHIDENIINNKLDNLQLITNRENVSRSKKGGTSKYTGVYYHKSSCKYISRILIGGKRKYLGYYDCELKAHLAYQKALKELV
jgi:hypothetical protein